MFASIIVDNPMRPLPGTVIAFPIARRCGEPTSIWHGYCCKQAYKVLEFAQRAALRW